MRFSAILLSLMAVIWLVLCLYLALPQLDTGTVPAR